MTIMSMSAPSVYPGVRPRPEKDWLSRKEAAIYLEKIGFTISARTLEKKAANNNAGKGPPFNRLGWKTVRYRRTDLEAWAQRETTRVE